MIWLCGTFASFALLWGVLFWRSRFRWVRSSGRADERVAGGKVRTLHFPAVDGTRLEGWLFLPESLSPPPVVVGDDMIPSAYVEEAHRVLGDRGELVTYDCGHFDLYVGPVQPLNAQRQADFLARELLASSE